MPYKIEMYALSRANMGRIISFLYKDDSSYYIKEVQSKNDKYLRYEIVFIDKNNTKIKSKLITNK